MGDVSFALLRKKSNAHAALILMANRAPFVAFSSAEDLADFIMEGLWKSGFKIVARDDGGEAT